jgi:hypothetical protein
MERSRRPVKCAILAGVAISIGKESLINMEQRVF